MDPAQPTHQLLVQLTLVRELHLGSLEHQVQHIQDMVQVHLLLLTLVPCIQVLLVLPTPSVADSLLQSACQTIHHLVVQVQLTHLEDPAQLRVETVHLHQLQ